MFYFILQPFFNLTLILLLYFENIHSELVCIFRTQARIWFGYDYDEIM